MKKKHLITTHTVIYLNNSLYLFVYLNLFFYQEHKCVLDSCRALEGEGFEVTYLPVQSSGLIDLNQLKEAIRPTTVLVSVMAVNNEMGVIQPLKEIGNFFLIWITTLVLMQSQFAPFLNPISVICHSYSYYTLISRNSGKFS